MFPFYILFPLDSVPFFHERKKTPTVFCCFTSERSSELLVETHLYYLFTLSLGNWIFEILRKISPTKSNAFFVLLIIVYFFKKSVVFIENALCFECNSRPTPTFACYVSFIRYEWEKQKKWQQPVPDLFDGTEEFFSELFFLDNGLKSQQGTVQLFGTKSNLKGSPLTSKATSGYFVQSVWICIKGNVPRFEKICLDANNKNFMWITCRCGNRRQSVPAEIFACIRR